MSLLAIVSIIIQLALIVHAIKTGRNTIWIFVVLFFPLVGSLAYLIVELLPGLIGSRTGRNAKVKLSQALNPGKGLREAEERYAVAGTVKNAMLLAEQFLQHQRYADARMMYTRCLTGMYADDPHLLLGLATSHYGLQEYGETLRCLDLLKEKNPQHTSAEGHLLYAKCLQGLARTAEAINEFQALAAYYPGPEPACHLAILLKQQGEHDKAKALLQDVIARANRGGRHYRDLHQEWIALAKSELRK